ncbi:MAG: RidA family protein [Bacteroidia bacterium]|nr:RidA family protein [Bacteroidia bacterium]
MKTNRRSAFKKLAAGFVGVLGFTAVKAGTDETNMLEENLEGNVVMDQDIPLFSSVRVHGGLVYISGRGAHFDGDITSHTKHVLDEIKEALEKAGSSMEHVLKANVYLNDLKDYKGMNEVFKGKFGKTPPVRTTIAAAGGIPGDSLVEIDCIAMLK